MVYTLKRCLKSVTTKLIGISLTHSLLELYFRTPFNWTVKKIYRLSLILPRYSKSKCRPMINGLDQPEPFLNISHLRTWFFMKIIDQNSQKTFVEAFAWSFITSSLPVSQFLNEIKLKVTSQSHFSFKCGLFNITNMGCNAVIKSKVKTFSISVS